MIETTLIPSFRRPVRGWWILPRSSVFDEENTALFLVVSMFSRVGMALCVTDAVAAPSRGQCEDRDGPFEIVRQWP